MKSSLRSQWDFFTIFKHCVLPNGNYKSNLIDFFFSVVNSNSWAVKVRQRASKGDPIKANANGKPGHTVSPRKTSYLSVFLNRGVLDYYSGIENVAIFNAVIYRSLSLASGMPPWAAVCHVEWKLWAHPGGVARTWHMAPSSSQDRKTKWNPQQEALPELVNSRSLTFKISWNERAKRASESLKTSSFQNFVNM